MSVEFYIAPWSHRLPGGAAEVRDDEAWRRAGAAAGPVVLSVGGDEVFDGPFPSADDVLSKRGRMFVRAPLSIDGTDTAWIDPAQRSGTPMKLAVVGPETAHFFPTARLSPVRWGQEAEDGSRVVALEWEVGHTGYRELA